MTVTVAKFNIQHGIFIQRRQYKPEASFRPSSLGYKENSAMPRTTDAAVAIATPTATAWDNAQAFADWLVATQGHAVARVECDDPSPAGEETAGKPPALTPDRGRIRANFFAHGTVTPVRITPRGNVPLEQRIRDLNRSITHHLAQVTAGSTPSSGNGGADPSADKNRPGRAEAVLEIRDACTFLQGLSIVRSSTPQMLVQDDGAQGRISHWVCEEPEGEPYAKVVFYSTHGYHQRIHVTPIRDESDSIHAFRSHLEKLITTRWPAHVAKRESPPPLGSNGDQQPPAPPDPAPSPTASDLQLTPSEAEACEYLLSFDPTGEAASFQIESPCSMLARRFPDNGTTRYTALVHLGLIIVGERIGRGSGRYGTILRRAYQTLPAGTRRRRRNYAAAPASPLTPDPVPPPIPPVPDPPAPPTPPAPDPVDPLPDEPVADSAVEGSPDALSVKTATTQLASVFHGMAAVMRYLDLALPHLRELSRLGCTLTIDSDGFKLHAPFTILDDQPPE